MRFVLFPLLISALSAASVGAATKPHATFKDWAVRCEDRPATSQDSPAHCYMVQRLVLKDKNQRVLVVAVTYPKGREQPVAVFTLPLGIALPPGIALAVDGDKPRRYAVDRCVANGCKAGIVLDAALLKRFKAGNRAMVTIHDGQRKPISLPVSLQGFTAALRSLRP